MVVVSLGGISAFTVKRDSEGEVHFIIKKKTIYISIPIHIHIYLYLYIYIYIHTYTYTYISIPIHIHIYLYLWRFYVKNNNKPSRIIGGHACVGEGREEVVGGGDAACRLQVGQLLGLLYG